MILNLVAQVQEAGAIEFLQDPLSISRNKSNHCSRPVKGSGHHSLDFALNALEHFLALGIGLIETLCIESREGCLRFSCGLLKLTGRVQDLTVF